MKENKIYYQVTCRKFGESHNMTIIYTFNDMVEAYKKYSHCHKVYEGLKEIEKMRVSVELYVIDRSSQGVKQVATVVACGYNVVCNYVYDDKTYGEMMARYCDTFPPVT